MDSTSYSGYRGWKGWHESDFGKLDASSALYFASEMLLCGYATLQHLSLLELGFGNGVFAAWAISQGALYRGTEMVPELIAQARLAGIEAFHARTPLDSLVSENSIDLAVALDVFEHVKTARLRTILHSLHLCLKLGGILVGRVPSSDSPFSRATQHGDLMHCNSFGSSAIQQIGIQAGFDVVAVREPAFPLSGGGTVAFIRRLLVLAARRMMYPIIVNAFMGGGHPVLTPNLPFVLRKPDGGMK